MYRQVETGLPANERPTCLMREDGKRRGGPATAWRGPAEKSAVLPRGPAAASADWNTSLCPNSALKLHPSDQDDEVQIPLRSLKNPAAAHASPAGSTDEIPKKPRGNPEEASGQDADSAEAKMI
jgi:hypothetical protein